MPIFNQLFYKNIEEPVREISLKNIERLRSIYNGEIVNYKNIQDFNACKQQLLLLLNYIEQLNPHTLEIFSIYSRMIEKKLLNTSSQSNINITLKATKKSIESSLTAIEENHNKFCHTTFKDYIVDQCIPGAFSNMECVLEHFHQDYFSLIIASTKKKLLQECIAQFVRQLDNKINQNYEIHFINGLYNTLSNTYGCAVQTEPLATKEFEERGIINRCKKYVEKKFTLSSFIQMLLVQIENPPYTVIDNNDDFLKIEDFFKTLNLNIKEKNHLYLINNDGYLYPKPNFNTYLECIIAYHLQMLGYINDTTLIIDNIVLFDSGVQIVGYDDNNQYRVLDDEYLLALIDNKNDSGVIKLIDQLSSKTLYQKFISSEQKGFFFNAILKKSYLPNEIIINLINFLCSHENNEPFLERFTNHIFFNLYPLPIDKISKLVNTLTQEKINKYFKRSIIFNKLDFLNVLLPYANKNCYKFAALFAAEHAHIKLLKTINQCININTIITQYEENTLAHIAVINRHLDMLKILYSLGANLHIKNRDGYSAVHLIFQFGDIPMLEWLLSEINPNLFKKIDLECYLLIHVAASENHMHILNWIQTHYPNLLNQIDEENHTIAHWAAYNNDLQTLAWVPLIDTKLLTIVDSEGFTPLLLAAQRNNVDAFKWIIKIYPEQLNHVNENGFTIAHIAAQHDSLGILKYLEKEQPELLSKTDNVGNLISHLAAYEKNINTLDWIRKHHYTLLNHVNNNGCTIAHIASYKAYTDLLLWIEKYNIDLFNKSNRDNNTSIHIAAQRGHMDILLLFHTILPEANWHDILNVKPHIYNNHQGTLVHLAVRTRHIHFLELLKKYNIDVNSTDKKGFTPLMLALCSNNQKFFHLLMKMGADIQVKNENANTLAHCVYKVKFNSTQQKEWLSILEQYNFSFELKNKEDQINQREITYDALGINTHPKNNGSLYGFFKNYHSQKKTSHQKNNQYSNLRASI